MLCGKCECGGGDEDSANALEEEVGAIAVRRVPQFASQATKPQDHVVRPHMSDMIHKQRCKQDQDEDATHPFQSLHSHIFHIQSIFLVKAIGMFNPRAIPPFSVHSLGIVGGMNWHVWKIF